MKRQVLRPWAMAVTAAMALGTIWVAPLKPLAQETGAGASTKEDVMEEQKETSRKSIQWWDSNFQVDPDSLFAPGYINHQEPIAGSNGEKGVTLDELKTIVASYHGAFPGTEVKFQMQVLEGNRVATHWTFSGTQKGTYEGLAPTDKSVRWAGVFIDEYDADGKIEQTWVVWDKFTLFRALGLIK